MKGSKFQFSNPTLMNLTFEINQKFQAPPDGTVDIQVSCHINVKRDPGKNQAVVELTVEAGNKNKEAPFMFKVTEGAQFKWEEEAKEIVDKLLRQNAPALLLGYIRPIVSVFTSSTPYGAYNLPFIDFTKD